MDELTTSASESTATPVAEPPAAPAEIWIDELNAAPFNELLRRSEQFGLHINPDKTRHHIVFDLLRTYSSLGSKLLADGVIEFSQQGNGFLRWPRFNFRSLPQDVMLPNHFERQLVLRNGNRMTVRIRPPRDREKFFVVEEILAIEDIPVRDWREHTEFEKLTAMHPSERIVLENLKLNSVTARAIDLIAPLGHGQRGLIIAPPRVGWEGLKSGADSLPIALRSQSVQAG